MGEAVDLVMKLAVMLFGAGAVYGGSRADLKSIREKAEGAERSASRAHGRIDGILQGRRRDDGM